MECRTGRRYTRKAKKGVPVKLTLKLAGRAQRTLRKKGKLRTTVRTTFTPDGGGSKVIGSKPVTFKRANR